MNAKKAFWKNDSGGVAVVKAVVSSNAHVVARNYEIKELHLGDIGLHARLDLNGQKLSELPDEQKRIAAALLEGMSDSLLADLGKNKARPLLSEGAVVYLLKEKAVKQDQEDELYYGTVEAQTEQGVRLRILNLRLARVEIKFFPWDREFTEVPGYSGWLGLLKYLLLEVKSDSALKFLGKEDEDVLIEAIIAQLEYYLRSEKHLNTETLIQYLAELTNQSNISRVMMNAKNKAIRFAALTMLDNQEAIVEFLSNSDNDYEEFAELVAKIDDQALIKRLICASDNYCVVKKAVAKFKGMADDFVLNVKSNIAQYCLIDANKVVNPANLRKVYDLTPDSSYHKIALARKLTLEEDIIAKVLEAENAESVKELIQSLNLDMVTKIAIDARSPAVAKEALDQIVGYSAYHGGAGAYFAKIAYESKYPAVRLDAVKRLDGEVLNNVVLNKNEDIAIRLCAFERMYLFLSGDRTVTVLQRLESDATDNPQIREAAKAKWIEIEKKTIKEKLSGDVVEMAQTEIERVINECDQWDYWCVENALDMVKNPAVLRKFISQHQAGDRLKDKAQARLLKLEHDRIVSMIAAGKVNELKQSELATLATDENEDIELRVRAIGLVDDKLMLRRWTSDHLFKIQEAAEARLLSLGKEF